MKKLLFRHRSAFLLGGALIAFIASLYSDPDEYGLSTLLGGLALVQGIWAIALSHWARKALMDYAEADMRNLFKKASEGDVGSGLALIAIAIIIHGLFAIFSPRAHAASLPDGFYKYGTVLKSEQEKYWTNHPNPVLLFGLIEQESCVSLKSKLCWNPKSSLKNSREEGAGLGQITRAYRIDGSVRFDALAGMTSQYSELSGLTWGNVYQRPELQLRAVVLMSRDAAKQFQQSIDMLAFGDASYNGGESGTQKERRACKLTPGCNPGIWFNNVENHCLKSRQPLYGGRSACDINREHVNNVMNVRWKKYVGNV